MSNMQEGALSAGFALGPNTQHFAPGMKRRSRNAPQSLWPLQNMTNDCGSFFTADPGDEAGVTVSVIVPLESWGSEEGL